MILSNMMDLAEGALRERIAARIGELRIMRGHTLETLAQASDVSRSMISLIERGESSPSAVVLDKLARALGTGLATFFDPDEGDALPSPVARHEDQPCWKDPDSGYRRRNVSPPGVPQPMRIVDIHFPAGARVTFDSPRDDAVQQVWVLGGTLEVTVGGERHTLHEGDCLAMRLDTPTAFHNPRRKAARYAVVMATDRTGQR